MNTKTAVSLTAGALILGLLGGIGLANSNEPTKAPEVGPTKTVAGVPVGYERSKTGAINAALGYEGALGALRRLAKPDRAAALNAMANPERQSDVAKSAEAAYDFFDQQFGDQGVIRSAVVGYHVKAYDQNAAEIELWEVSVVGRPDTIPVRSGWATRTIRLRWHDEDWKLEALPDEAPGPTPQDNGSPTDPTQVLETARRLGEVRYATAPLS